MHPLLDDLTKLKDQDLENKLSDLTRKYFTAMRMGNGLVGQQIVMVLDSIKMEQERRRFEAARKASENPNKGDFDDLIKIN